MTQQNKRPLWLTTFLILTFISACTQPYKKFDGHLAGGRCDRALKELPENDPMIKLTHKTEQAAGTLLSYSFVGASYTAEVLWDATGHTLVLIALCGPMLAAVVASNASSGSSSEQPGSMNCLPMGTVDGGVLSAPPLGRRALKSSKSLRCPKVDSIYDSLRKVSDCYESSGEIKDLAKALKNYEGLINSTDFFACLDPLRQRHATQKVKTLKGTLATFSMNQGH